MPIYDMEKTQGNVRIGEAYTFFYCDASKKEIEKELYDFKNFIDPQRREQIPSELELSLTKGMDNVRGDPKLVSLAEEAQEQGINYLLKATYPGATNRAAAEELKDISNQLYTSQLYEKGEEFRRGIFYKDNGEYHPYDG